MKKITLIIVAFLFVNITFSQNEIKEEAKIVQDLFGARKKEIIKDNISLKGVDSNKFWELYDAYESKRKEIGSEKIDLLYKYTMHDGAVSNTQAEQLLKSATKIRAAKDNLIKSYTKKIKKATNPLVASQFYQIEHYIADGINFTILDNIDFIQDK